MYYFTFNRNELTMEFNLNEKEKDNLNKFIEAFKVLYGEDVIYKKTYCFTPTGIGNNIIVIIKAKPNISIEKDITDYESW